MRRAANRDRNEAEIVEALRKVGATVAHISSKDVPDLLVGFRGFNYLLEVKAPAGARGGTKGHHAELSEGQALWHAGWKGRSPVVVRSAAQALDAIGAPVSVFAREMAFPSRKDHNKPYPALRTHSKPSGGENAAAKIGEAVGKRIAARIHPDPPSKETGVTPSK